ncbi:MAG: hypothetical protein EOO77_31185 [Oxalobacteraceae bacterium]|nr:MAG: hypothetical protein EOO77_31185 [Oxalobacteraceae bacterium]
MRYHEFARAVEIDEAFNDLGKTPPDQLIKGQPLDPNAEKNFHEVDGRMFFNVITRLRNNDLARMETNTSKGLNSLSVYALKDYMKMRCFIGMNNSSGFAIKGDELVSVFSTQRSSGHALCAAAVQNGAKRLDCFATRQGDTMTGPLYRLYKAHGFVVDQNMNEGTPGEAFAIQNGISSFVNDAGQVEPENPSVVVFMVRP